MPAPPTRTRALRAWELGPAPEQIVLDLDATLVTFALGQAGAADNYKGGYEDQSVIAIEQPALDLEARENLSRPAGPWLIASFATRCDVGQSRH